MTTVVAPFFIGDRFIFFLETRSLLLARDAREKK